MTEELNETVKVLSQTVEKLAKSLEARHDTCCKHITISVITIALFTTIAICCIFGQRNNQHLEGKCEPNIIKVQVETQPSKVIEIPSEQQ